MSYFSSPEFTCHHHRPPPLTSVLFATKTQKTKYLLQKYFFFLGFTGKVNCVGGEHNTLRAEIRNRAAHKQASLQARRTSRVALNCQKLMLLARPTQRRVQKNIYKHIATCYCYYLSYFESYVMEILAVTLHPCACALKP